MEASSSIPADGTPPEGGGPVADVAADTGGSPAVTESPAAAGGPLSVEDQLSAILDNQHKQSAEMARFRKEIDDRRATPQVGPAPTALNQEQLRQQRLDQLAEAKFYCPGCGRTSEYQRECFGRGEAPHAGIEMVSTDEVKNPPNPQTDPEGYAKWEQNQTAAPATVV